MLWPKTGATHCQALLDKGRAIRGLIVYNKLNERELKSIYFVVSEVSQTSFSTGTKYLK